VTRTVRFKARCPKETPKNGSEFVGEFASTYMYEEITYTFSVHTARGATQQGFHTNSLANSLPNKDSEPFESCVLFRPPRKLTRKLTA
jgi:hypothetical protein